MNIFITIPDFSRHGGIRVIVEWANRLTRWHNVYLHPLRSQTDPSWLTIAPAVKVIDHSDALGIMDCLIITSPHSIHFQNRPDCPDKVFLFMQMAEHLFRPDDMAWRQACTEFYTSKHPMFCISAWNIDMLRKDFGRTGECIYIGNGVNMDDFPISHAPKDGKTVLVEGWEAGNPSKDYNRIGPAVARMLRKYGYRILAYGIHPCRTLHHVPHEYYIKPDTNTLNMLYERATILIKASRYDARSCSPMEAMTKGTVTVRAIEKGDDDLVHDVNCYRTDYNMNSLLSLSLQLLRDADRREQLADACWVYVQRYSWDYWMNIVEQRLSK